LAHELLSDKTAMECAQNYSQAAMKKLFADLKTIADNGKAVQRQLTKLWRV
jgi:hypothetical protein